MSSAPPTPSPLITTASPDPPSTGPASPPPSSDPPPPTSPTDAPPPTTPAPPPTTPTPPPTTSAEPPPSTPPPPPPSSSSAPPPPPPPTTETTAPAPPPPATTAPPPSPPPVPPSSSPNETIAPPQPTTAPPSTTSIAIPPAVSPSTVIGKATSTASPTSVKNTTIKASATNSPKSKPQGGVIAGSVIGSLAGLALLLFLVYFCIRRRRYRDNFESHFEPGPEQRQRVDLGEGVTSGVVAPFQYHLPHHDHETGYVAGGGGGLDRPYPPHWATRYSSANASGGAYYDAGAGVGRVSDGSSGSFDQGDPQLVVPGDQRWDGYDRGSSLPTAIMQPGHVPENANVQTQKLPVGRQQPRMNGSPLAKGSGVVRQDEDGPSQEQQPTEIPPTYESVPAGRIKRVTPWTKSHMS